MDKAKKRTVRIEQPLKGTAEPSTIVLGPGDVEEMVKDQHQEDAGIITGKGVTILLSHLREIKASQDRGFDIIEKRLDKIDDEIDKIHESLGRAMRSISENATRIDYLEANVTQIQRDLKEVERNQHQCRARLNYEEDTGQFKVDLQDLQKKVWRSKSTTPPKPWKRPDGLPQVPPSQVVSLVKYVGVGIISALLAAGSILATAWHKIMQNEGKDRLEQVEQPKPLPEARKRKAEPKPVDENTSDDLYPPAATRVPEPQKQVNSK